MNFLSHYYFDRQTSALRIMGSLLPDFIKNAGKFKIESPLKQPEKYSDPGINEIYLGWENHIIIDKLFHSSDFFYEQTQIIKEKIKPITEGTEIRPSFLAHISLELMLDHLLIKYNHLHVQDLYTALQTAPKETIIEFLNLCRVESPETVMNFLNNFTSSKYLISYQKTANIAYALNRICMRVWPEGMEKQKIDDLHDQLDQYLAENEKELLKIFNVMTLELSNYKNKNLIQ